MGKELAEGEKERSQPPALRATSFQRKEGDGQGVGRAKRGKC